MNESQLATLGTHIRSNVVVADALAAGNLGNIREWYNGDVEPAVSAWKHSVSIDDANDAIDWTEYMEVPVLGADNLAGVKLSMEQNTSFQRQNNALNQLFRNGDFNPSLQTIRDALGEIFAGDPNTKAALLVLAKRNATNAESLFASGPVQGAVVLDFVGSVSTSDVDRALELTA